MGGNEGRHHAVNVAGREVLVTMTQENSQRRKNVAILGCAIPTLILAPFGDPNWELWGTGNFQDDVKDWHSWFDIHDLDNLPRGFEKHLIWLGEQTKPVWIARPSKHVPNGVLFPFEKYERQYPPAAKEFLTSTVAWLFAKAIDEMPEKIGLWGIEMCTDEEYAFQRAGVKFFQIEAQRKGIEVIIPLESDLAREKVPYPFCEETPLAKWLIQREVHIRDKRDVMAEQSRMVNEQIIGCNGALDILVHLRRHTHW